jgi:predicted phosphodiesterase
LAKRVIAVPDLHFPFHHAECLSWIYDHITLTKPDVVIQLGDLYDMYSASKFARTHDLMTPKQELAEARLAAEAFWRNVQQRAPNARCLQILGNHDVRPNKRIQEVAPELESLLNTSVLFQFSGVETTLDTSADVEIDGVIYTHGTFIKLGDHAKHYFQPVVHGHTHRGATFFMRQHGKNIWELDCGFASDETQVPLRYTATRRTGWTLGLGVVSEYGPSFRAFPAKK